MANLNAQTISVGVNWILSVENGIDASTARQIKDGDGTVSPFYITTAKVGIGESTPGAVLDIKAVDTSPCLKLNDQDSAADSNWIELFDVDVKAWEFRKLNDVDDSDADADLLIRNGAGTSVLGLKQSNGNIGMGTASPGYALEIQGAASPTIVVHDTTTPVKLQLFADDSLCYVGSLTNHNLTFRTNGTRRMTIDTSGRVGIGTTAPSSDLEIASASGTLTITRHNITDGSFPVLDFKKSANASIGSVATTVVSGEGLGTIRWYGSEGSAFAQSAYIGAFASGTINSGDVPAELRFATTADLGSGATPTVRMTIDDAGNVGIGDTGPSTKLSVIQSADAQTCLLTHAGSTDAEVWGMRIDFSGADPDDETQYFLKCEDSVQNKFFIYSSGDYWSADGGAINSDERLKENIVDATSKLDDINKLKVRNWNWRETDKDSGQKLHNSKSASRKRIGLIAQEVEEIFPSLVTDGELVSAREAVEAIEAKDAVLDSDGNIIEVAVEAVEAVAERKQLIRKNLKMNALIPMLVKAIQELSAKVEALENA